MGDSAIVLVSVAYLVGIAFLLGTSGLVETHLSFPTGLDSQGASSATSSSNSLTCIVSSVLGGIVSLAIFCPQALHNIPVIGTIVDIFAFSFTMTAFLFQLITFSVPGLPPILNAIIILPPGVALAYIGIKLARGTGG